MPLSIHDLYRSENGDRWQLVREEETGRETVRHEPNLSSGGQTTDMGVQVFLDRSGSSPQHEALKAFLSKRLD